MKKHLLALLAIFFLESLEARFFIIHNNSQYKVSIKKGPNDTSPVIVMPITITQKTIDCTGSLTISTSDPVKAPRPGSPAQQLQGFTDKNPLILNIDCSDYRTLDLWINDAKGGIFVTQSMEIRPRTYGTAAAKRRSAETTPLEKKVIKIEE